MYRFLNQLSSPKFLAFERRFISTVDRAKQFEADRDLYKDSVSVLRKKWQAEHKKRVEDKKAADELFQRQRRLGIAMRSREKKKKALERKEKDRLTKASYMQAYKEHLQRLQIDRDLDEKAKNIRFETMKKQLQVEQSEWITRENLSEKINLKLFETPSTTGMITKFSPLWRIHPVTMNLRRKMSQELANEYNKNNGNTDVEKAINQYDMSYKMDIEDFLNPMIGTGEDRSKMKHYVKNFAESFAVLSDAHGEFEEYIKYISIIDDTEYGSSTPLSKSQLPNEEAIKRMETQDSDPLLDSDLV